MELKDIMKFGNKTWIIWVSCLERPRSMKEIMDEWDYKTGAGALYRSEITTNMLQSNIIRLVKVDKENFYSSDFSWITKDFWKYFVKLSEPKVKIAIEKEILKQITEHFEEYMTFLNEESVRKALFKIKDLKQYYINPNFLKQRPSDIFQIPISVYQFFSQPKKIQEKYIEAMNKMYSMIFGTQPFNVGNYLKTLNEEEISRIKFPEFMKRMVQKLVM